MRGELITGVTTSPVAFGTSVFDSLSSRTSFDCSIALFALLYYQITFLLDCVLCLLMVSSHFSACEFINENSMY